MIESIVQSEGTLVLIPKKQLDDISASLNELKALVKNTAKRSASAEWIESTEARKLLGVSQRTWQNYRDSKVLPFSQFGRKIYVKKADIEAFLENHKVNR